jgi:PKHD-type hydroxylase
MRRTKIRFINAGDWRFEYIFNIFWKTGISANDDFFQFNISRLTYLQFAEYNSNVQAEYKTHHDVFWMNNDPEYHRKLTAVVQLTDPLTYVGGDFQMFDLAQNPNADEIKTQGTVIFLPSFIEHQANPVIKGTRYSLACWFDGPKWK